VDADRNVCIQLGNTRSCGLVARLANILRPKEELCRKIGDGNRRRVVEGQALDACKGDILGNLNTKTPKANDEHVRRAHALHCLVAKDIELATVERLIDLGRARVRVIDLHLVDGINLLRFTFLRETVRVSKTLSVRQAIGVEET